MMLVLPLREPSSPGRAIALEIGTPRRINKHRPYPLAPPRSDRGCHGNHKERVHFAVFAADRDVFSGVKGMGTEAVSGLLVFPGALAVVEHPARMLGAARLVHEVAMLLLVVPKPAHAAIFAMLLPLRRVDMPGGVEGRNELVTMARRAGWVFLRPRQI